MFMTMMLLAWTLLHAYVLWRAASVPAVARRVPRRVLIGAGVLLWASFFLVRLLGHDASGTAAAVLEVAVMDWMATLFLVSVALLAVDLVTGFGLLLPRLAPRLRGWGFVAGGLLALVAVVQGMRPPVVVPYEVRLPGLPADADGTVVVAVSDLHLGNVLGPGWLAARLAQVRAQRPDMVVLLGDVFEGHGEPGKDAAALIRGLRAPLGVWAVTGNHEYHGGRRGGVTSLDATGLRVLHDRWAEAAPGLVVAGVDDLTSRRRSGGDGASAVLRSLAGRPPGAVILLSHTPWDAGAAAKAGAGLMLSGHTHGGQVWPFGVLERKIYPLMGGRYEVAGTTVIVCRGTGTWGPRMRLWRPGEILRITLRAAPSAPEPAASPAPPASPEHR